MYEMRDLRLTELDASPHVRGPILVFYPPSKLSKMIKLEVKLVVIRAATALSKIRRFCLFVLLYSFF